MGTYIVGDIHGCYSEWIQFKDRIEAEDKEAVFILVGDIIDRGTEVYQMLQWAMQNITPDGKYQMVIGNHEFDKQEWLESYLLIAEKNGDFGLDKVMNDGYNFKEVCVNENLSNQQLREILDWIKKLEFYKELNINKQKFIVVHSTLPKACLNKDGTFSKSSIAMRKKKLVFNKAKFHRRKIVWDRNYSQYADRKCIVIHGHTPTISSECVEKGAEPGRIWINNHNINVDCGLVFKKNGNLAALRIEDMKEFYLYQ